LNSSENIIRAIKSRMMKLTGHVAMGAIRNAYTISIGRPEGRSPHGRQRHRW